MIKKGYTVTDLGVGDGGKGGVVHKLCTTQNPHTVIKVGGTQGSHGVWTSKGENFAFSQFGCGTFEGIKTFISRNFVSSPIGLLNEAHALKYEKGISNPFELLSVDENVLCTTPYHGMTSRIKELARKNNPRSIIGTGTGEAYIDSQLFPDLAFRISDLTGAFEGKLKKVREYKLSEVESIIKNGFLPGDMDLTAKEMEIFQSEEYFKSVVDKYKLLAKELTIVDDKYLRENILNRDGVFVIESSHGILTDYLKGFSPHTSRLRTLPQISSWDLLQGNNYDGQIVRLGVTRAYQIKHGAGPFVVDDESMAKVLYTGSYELEDPDRFRGKVRVGPLDTVMLRYAINASGGPGMYDAVCLTWFDSVFKLGKWSVCDSYNNVDPKYFSENGDILVKDFVNEADQITYQTALTQSLESVTPNISEHYLGSNPSQEEIINLCKTTLDMRLGVPIRMVGLGPTEDEKVLF
jgi:adenylosuccinate synthase